MLLERLTVVRALLAARTKIGATMAIVMDSDTAEAAVTGIAELLETTDTAARVVFNTPIRVYQMHPVDLLSIEANELVVALDHAQD
ncbi:hypothetical protein PA27867_2061 [Cryobacterium arcticum]|uniref:Uncharacterized protein n=1 Tax=Cryobacterium arcticum TaxID=670052 RepID=A0A1B1BKT1_9MICO|nr:hypothetical protein PA27867_2061 [Cryobacterium arcticum]